MPISALPSGPGPRPPMLSRAGYDRAALHRTNEAWLQRAWHEAAVLQISPGSRTPTQRDADGHARLWLADSAHLPGEMAQAPRRFLGLVDGRPYFAITVDDPDDRGLPTASDIDAPRWLNLREIAAAFDDVEAGLMTCAIALEQWHQRHPRCPLCGAATVEAHAGWVRRCPADDSTHFPRTDPAVIMLIHDGADRALLGRAPSWPAGRFSTLAGFVEPGESLEAAVAREVFEEVGVGIREVRYVASQPWPFPASLMVGFTARLDGDPGITLDPVEMAEAGWFTRDEVAAAADWGADRPPAAGTAGDTRDGTAPRLRALPPRLSISRYLIDLWLGRDPG